MFLQLLNITKYINDHKLMEVKSYRIPSKVYDEDGLWSEIIFGPIGSKTRSERFGYINLKNKFIHPIVFDMLSTVSNETSQIIREKGKFIIENEKYIESENGNTGISFLINTFNDVKFEKFAHPHKKENAKYLDNNKQFVLIDKFLVIPAANRDIDIYNKGGRIQIEEINDLYSKLLIYIQQLTGIEEIDSITNKKIQMQLIAIIEYIRNTKLRGKKGLFRGIMLKKSMDYSSRLVLTNDPNIELGTIGIPYHTLIAIFEPFVIHHLFKKPENLEILLSIQSYLKLDTISYNDFQKFTKDLITNPDIIPFNIKANLIKILNQFLDDQVVLCKRDPVVQRKSWFSAKPVITEGRVAYVNSMDLGPLGGDCVKGDIITFTKENNKFIKHIESIDEFYKNHDLTFINKKTNESGSEVYDFIVNDEIYSIGVNEQTLLLQYSQIERWSIHNNIKLFTAKCDKFESDLIISENNSCFVYNTDIDEFQKLSISDIITNISTDTKLFFIKFLSLNQEKKIEPILSDFINFLNYQNGNLVNININDITINTTEDKVAYDLTMKDEHVRSFLHSSMILQCNSDGDTVALFPIFTNEAKKEVRQKMNPTINKSKWKDISSYNGVIYSPTLDAIATVYSATLK